jgi:hypothetical protein
MDKKNTKPQKPQETYAQLMRRRNWGANNGRLRPRAEKDTYFAGTLPSPPEPEISVEDIALLGEIFRGRQGLF